MKNARIVSFASAFMLAVLLLTACSAATPTPLVIVVTATPLPPTQAPLVEPTSTQAFAPVSLAGPQSGAKMKWIDGSTLLYVPQSEFEMGYGYNAPIHSVSLDAYWIQQTKVTNRMFAQCVAVGSCTPPTQEVGGPVYSNPEFASHPVVGVTWDQAQAYCAWTQGSLPSEAQWEKAARGLGGNTYPWGNDEPACDLLNFGFCSGRTSEVTAFLSGASPFGLLDMAGNVFEWAADWYSDTYYNEAPALNPTGPAFGEDRVIRGSSFETNADQLPSAVRHFGPQTYHSRDLGFRCVVPNPQPVAPYCQLSALVPTGAPDVNGCELPAAQVTAQYCSGKQSYAHLDIPEGAVYDVGKNLNCEEVVVEGQRRLVCTGPQTQETTTEITVCNPACSGSPDVTGAKPSCGPGYTLDPATGACNYTPILPQVNVAGCPVGYSVLNNGGQQTCVLALDANGQCSAGLYFDSLAGMCVPANGAAQTPYGIDNPGLASQTFAGCAAGYTYSDTFQCCQAATADKYPGCPPGTSFNTDLGACSVGEVKLSGPGCVTVDVTTLQCDKPVDVCFRIVTEVACIRNAYACTWIESQGKCQMKTK
ncbi:MAG: formylglycine-generating enzyme family protein [Chloroflexi bacterium]|nr:formylglycine-generating enzyme family protein [Chloroflexota bacterium]